MNDIRLRKTPVSLCDYNWLRIKTKTMRRHRDLCCNKFKSHCLIKSTNPGSQTNGRTRHSEIRMEIKKIIHKLKKGK